MTSSYVMKISVNGQVSIPADVRARWRTDRVVVVDLGDRVVMRPLVGDPVAAVRGKYRRLGPTSDEARAQARREEGAAGRSR